MSERLCKDCRWVTWPWPHIRDSGGAMCIHPSVMRPDPGGPDPVTGRPRVVRPGTFCELERRLGVCGSDGTHWEPRQPREQVGFVDDDPPPRTGDAMAEPE